MSGRRKAHVPPPISVGDGLSQIPAAERVAVLAAIEARHNGKKSWTPRTGIRRWAAEQGIAVHRMGLVPEPVIAAYGEAVR